jgi:hypothetical protein
VALEWYVSILPGRFHYDLPMSPHPPTGNHFIVCGDDSLAYRITRELTSRYGKAVTVILPSRQRNGGPLIAALPGVTVLERAELSSEALADADV